MDITITVQRVDREPLTIEYPTDLPVDEALRRIAEVIVEDIERTERALA